MKHSVEKWSVSISQWRNLEARINIQWIQDSETQAIAKHKRINQLNRLMTEYFNDCKKNQNCSKSCFSLCFLKYGFQSYWYEKKHKTVS